MSHGFVAAPCEQNVLSSHSQFLGCICARQRPSTGHFSQRHASRNLSMMAKFQQKKEESSSSIENESELEKILPPSALPTLTTLSEKNDGIDLSAISSAPATTEEGEKENVGQMGPGFSPSEEMNLLAFLKGVLEELKYIEWPPFGRVVRLSVLILITVIVAATALYFIDGFFYRMSQLLFEGSAV